MADLFLVRHAQPNKGKQKLLFKQVCGSSALSEIGRAQARVTAQRLHFISATHLYTSPVPRALETGQLISASLGIELRVRADLKEQAWGPVFRGLRPEDIPILFPNDWQKWQSGDPEYGPPGGETTGSFLLRVDRFLAEIEDFSGTVIAVTHFGFIQGVVCRILDLPFRFSMPLDFGESSITHVGFQNGERILISLNDTSHWEVALGVKKGSFRVPSDV